MVNQLDSTCTASPTGYTTREPLVTLGHLSAGLAHFSPRYCCASKHIRLMTAGMVHHVTNLTPPGGGSDNPLVKTPVDDSRQYGPCNQYDTPRECQPYPSATNTMASRFSFSTGDA
jgi:hypothetical protein